MFSFFDPMTEIPRSPSTALASSSSSSSSAAATSDQEVCLESVTLQDRDPLQLANKLRSGHFSQSSHLDFLEVEIKSQLAFAQKHLESLEQKNVFRRFQLELEQCVAKQSLSYEWWICFAHRLTILITPEIYRKASYVTIGENSKFVQEMLEHNLWQRHDDFMALVERKDSLHAEMFRYIIDLFPEYVLIPSTIGDFSLTLLNRAVADKTYPLGIIAKGIWADGQFFYPDRFIRHDWVHFTNWYTLCLDEERSI